MRVDRPFLAVLALLGMVLGAAGGGTLAQFSAVTPNDGNSFSAAASFAADIAHVKTIGSATCTGSPTTLTVPAGGVAAGNTLIVRVALRGSLGSQNGTVSASDSRGNTYTIDFDYLGSANLRHVLMSARVSTALAASDTITVTHPNATARGVSVDEFSGIAATRRLDITAGAYGTSAGPSVSATTSNANDLVYGFVTNALNHTYTEATGWTLLTHLAMNCGGGPNPKADGHAAYRIVSALGTYTYNPTMSGSDPWTAAIVSYKAAGSPGAGRSIDVNGDGKDDVAGVNSSNQVWYSTNLSTWTQVPGSRTSLVVGDFDGNGRDDLAGLDGSNQVWYTTDLATWTQVPGSRVKLTVGDFDGNGRDDLAGLDGSNQVWYTTDLSTWTQVPGSRMSLVAGDFDGNGRDDLAGLDGSNQVWYTTDLATWSQIGGSRTFLTVGDFDGNGRDDLAALDASEALWYTTNLSTWTSIPGAAVLLVAGDFDVNGRDDLAALNSSEMIWYSLDLYNWTQIAGTAVSLVAGDLDGNGRDDLVARNSANEIWYTTNVFDTSVSTWTKMNVLLASLASRPS